MIAEERAYAAGLFDGEGCVSIGKGRRASAVVPIYSLSVKITQDDTEALHFIRNLWGGQIRPRKPRPDGKIASDWTSHSRAAGLFLADILPFLIVKRDEAEIAVKFQAAKYHPGSAGLPAETVAFFARCREDLFDAKHGRRVA